MKRILLALTVAFAVPGIAAAQDQPPKDEGISPQGALKELEEIRKLMGSSEESLHGASLGKGVLTQEEILKKLKDPEKDPERLQKEVLKLVDRLLKRSEQDQEQVIKRIVELIKKAKAQGQGRSRQQQQQKQSRGKQRGQPQQVPQPGSPATSPYNPNRTDPPSKFRSVADRHGEWGNLPPKERDRILQERRMLDQFPVEYQEMLRRYWKGVMEESTRD